MKRRVSVTNFSLENNLPMFQLNAPVVIRAKDVGKLFSELNLVVNNLLFIYAEVNLEATERKTFMDPRT